MTFIWAVSSRRIKQGIVIILAALFTAIFLFVEQDQQPVFSTADGPRAIDRVKTDQKQVALTFDIGWGDEQMKPVLDTLEKHDINNSTFFLSGAWAERHPELVEMIDEEEYEIGSLGYRYKNYLSMDTKDVKKDIHLAENALKDITEKRPVLLRPPSGLFDQDILEVTDKMNVTIVHWSVNSEDWRSPGVKNIVNNVLTNVQAGDIILMHASDAAKQTPDALPLIIEQLKEQGFTFATVSQLMADTKTKTKEVE